MKFLAITKPTAAMGMLPPDVRLQLLEASFAGMQQHREKRTVLEWYYSPIGYFIVILDYDNAEEWVNGQASVPILNYVDQELYPLADGMASMKAMLESMKAAMG